MDQKEVNLMIKRSILDNRSRELIIHPNFISFENKDLISDCFTRFNKNDLSAFRFGIEWIKGAVFTIGRNYQIFIRDKSDEVLKINFQSIYGINKADCNQVFSTITDTLWKYYFDAMANDLIDKFLDGQEFAIGDVYITKRHLVIKVSGVLKGDRKEISWKQLKTKSYSTYFALYSKEDPSRVNRGYSYLGDWNTAILQKVVSEILSYFTPHTSAAG